MFNIELCTVIERHEFFALSKILLLFLILLKMYKILQKVLLALKLSLDRKIDSCLAAAVKKRVFKTMNFIIVFSYFYQVVEPFEFVVLV